jgi:hypothetical protein
VRLQGAPAPSTADAFANAHNAACLFTAWVLRGMRSLYFGRWFECRAIYILVNNNSVGAMI